MTEDQIKQYALYELGFEDDLDFTSMTSKPVIRMNFIYEQVKRQSLSRTMWGFALKRAKLTGQTSLTDERYDYSYDLPSDFIFLRNQYRSEKGNSSIADYEFIDGKFYTDEKEVWIDYTADVEETTYPDYFIEYLKYKLAFDLCFNLTGDTDLMAFLSEREKFEYINASNIDARQRRVKRIQSSPFVNVRGHGSGRKNFKA